MSLLALLANVAVVAVVGVSDARLWRAWMKRHRQGGRSTSEHYRLIVAEQPVSLPRIRWLNRSDCDAMWPDYPPFASR